MNDHGEVYSQDNHTACTDVHSCHDGSKAVPDCLLFCTLQGVLLYQFGCTSPIYSTATESTTVEATRKQPQRYKKSMSSPRQEQEQEERQGSMDNLRRSEKRRLFWQPTNLGAPSVLRSCVSLIHPSKRCQTAESPHRLLPTRFRTVDTSFRRRHSPMEPFSRRCWDLTLHKVT